MKTLTLKSKKQRLNIAIAVAISASTLISLPASANEKVRWKVQAVFGTHLPALGDPIKYVSEQIKEASNGNIQFKIYEPGKLVPPFGITEAVKNKQLNAGYTWLGYDQGKIPAAALFAAVPFGMEPWAYASWWYDGEGKKLAEKLYAKHNIHPVLCSVIGPETAGWFKKELKSLKDIEGLKIRFAGLGGKVMQKAGASVTVLPGGEIFPALEKGAIDASEFSMPAIDQMMGFDKIAKNNYFPGWHQTFTASHLVVNTDTWNSLTDGQKAMIDMACTAGTFRALTRGEALQGSVINGFEAKNVTARQLPDEVLDQLKSLTDEVMSEISAKDADFEEIYQSQQAFAEEYKVWKSRAYLPNKY
ncbi:putative TRAP-type mannitol/chloroaromatic compound transport system, periplasmic component [Vibrio nigripulchritudo SO65]|uniref:TRAP transporter substrate-binding protein n=1 Tax=Vibrio nigripulchritudo TaxID=28173 RepID=UPI0003B2067F|nr:TRAP transporter substrate-binding protein [Vibrio nigripulchritudo]CCN34393.1 putative TRAP-type mannitol/chloroaromatic compound transport system, periplasmic component [Vibrio nigripulchritudo AM115]CCN39160.1 putative TRAP-type mannitol/chloroaromatic compound transport system, periplasmic component [Vibrio nigripulchritudo FTn2]CCN63185.1 putative TRAP-type mannitol/chloroaromatic compound transport system, periplasmic component [Vibrio nigripulchritudo POn4]CCN78310.1 putative TRAP-typ